MFRMVTIAVLLVALAAIIVPIITTIVPFAVYKSVPYGLIKILQVLLTK